MSRSTARSGHKRRLIHRPIEARGDPAASNIRELPPIQNACSDHPKSVASASKLRVLEIHERSVTPQLAKKSRRYKRLRLAPTTDSSSASRDVSGWQAHEQKA